jgi:uridine kinase
MQLRCRHPKTDTTKTAHSSARNLVERSKTRPRTCQDTFQSGDRSFFTPASLPHVATTAYTPDEVDSAQERREVAQQMLSVMKEYPHKTMIVGVVESAQRQTDVIVAGPEDSVSRDDTVGVYEFLQRTGSSPSVKHLSRAFPSSYTEVTAFDPDGLTDRVRLPGPLLAETVGNLLQQGGRTNNQEMLSELIDQLPKGERGVVLIGGPSGSGKSYLIRRLQELAGDRNLVTIEGDNYFRDVDDPNYPKLENGNHYFDHFEALDSEGLKTNIEQLIEDGKAKIPIYDFGAVRGDPEDWDLPVKGIRVGYRDVALDQDDILVIDSLHAANPKVQRHLREAELPVVSVYLDTPSANDRLVRRIVRDYHHRGGITPEQSLQFWDQTTRRGETEFIRPSMKAVDPAQGVFLITSFEGEPHINRPKIEARSSALKEHGLMPEYEAYNVPAEQMGPHAKEVEQGFRDVLADPESTSQERAKAEKGLELIEAARG